MNISDLRKTLALLEQLGDEEDGAASPVDQRVVLVRGDRSGVFYGTLASEDGRVVELTNARHVWSWTGALNVADLAVRGPASGKITGETPRIRVLDAIEICDVGPDAVTRFAAVTPWAP